VRLIRQGRFVLTAVSFLSLAVSSFSKVKQFGPVIALRPVTIKNVSYATSGKYFALPNFITAGSVGIFFVSSSGEIGSIPTRLSDRNFSRTAGVFYYFNPKDNKPAMVYIPLPELLSGYSVTFAPQRDTLAIAGGEKIFIYDANDWRQIKNITITANTTRVIYSPDGKYLAALAEGIIYVFETEKYTLLYKITPEQSHLFADITFSSNNEKLAALEYKSVLMDQTGRVRVFFSKDGSLDRNLPYLSDRFGPTPNRNFPLISYSPRDSAIAVTVEKSFGGKVFLIKSNDGTVLREFKGLCHAFSPDGSLFAAGGKVYATSTWTILGGFSSTATSLTFSPTERVLVVVTSENMKRYRIEE